MISVCLMAESVGVSETCWYWFCRVTAGGRRATNKLAAGLLPLATCAAQCTQDPGQKAFSLSSPPPAASSCFLGSLLLLL
jgi:hypothetical protein